MTAVNVTLDDVTTNKVGKYTRDRKQYSGRVMICTMSSNANVERNYIKHEPPSTFLSSLHADDRLIKNMRDVHNL